MFDQVADVLADELNRLLREVPSTERVRAHDLLAREFVAQNEQEIKSLIEKEEKRSAAKGVGFNQDKVYSVLVPRLIELAGKDQYKDAEGPLY